jgi:hypothetical protein
MSLEPMAREKTAGLPRGAAEALRERLCRRHDIFVSSCEIPSLVSLQVSGGKGLPPTPENAIAKTHFLHAMILLCSHRLFASSRNRNRACAAQNLLRRACTLSTKPLRLGRRCLSKRSTVLGR